MIDKTKLFQKKIHGDLTVVSKMLGISSQYANMLLKRERAKRHIEAMDALTKVIEARENLFPQK